MAASGILLGIALSMRHPEYAQWLLGWENCANALRSAVENIPVLFPAEAVV